MKKVFTWKVIRKWLILSTVFVVGFGVSFVYGTFNPNYFVKSIWQEKLETKHALWAHSLGLHSPSMEYNNRMEFIEQLNKCVDYLNFTTPPNQRIPMNMLTAQAVLESAWGESRASCIAAGSRPSAHSSLWPTLIQGAKVGPAGR